MLISFESEVNNIRKQYEAQGFEVVIPKTNILAEFKQADKFPQTELFRVEDKFGSWPEVMKTHFASGGELDKLLAAGRK